MYGDAIEFFLQSTFFNGLLGETSQDDGVEGDGNLAVGVVAWTAHNDEMSDTDSGSQFREVLREPV
jgi:hypothetical protein